MKEVQVHDRVFVPYISPEKIAEKVKELAAQINRDYAGKDPVLIGVLNGAFIFLADLVRALDCKPHIGFIGLSSYGDGMESSGKIKKTMELNTDVKGKDVLIVEDIVDNGLTVSWLREELMRLGANSAKVAVLLYKPASFKGKTEPEYHGFPISNEFVVGNGLDYAGMGRELNGIYQLKS